MSPPTIESKNGEKDALLEAAKLMLVAARTAPKTGGVDDILTLIVYGKEKDAIAEKMEQIAEERKIEGFKRDAKNVRDSEAVILIGVKGNKSFILNCGACGYKSCKDFEEAEKRLGIDFKGPTCIFKALDLGVALGSAVKMASILNVDNRIMYRVGTAAFKLQLMPEATIIMGIPISAKGKSIYFDRK
ncbi:MAG: ferredoxin domain-containing protein [Candidatus Bathycorpusculaceae bacterium]